ncbi:MAG: hypothetical protein AAF211_25510 [Myxococcota bacterium]
MREPIGLREPFVVTVALATSLWGCALGGRLCTEIGCTDSVTIEVRAPSGGFGPGDYEVSAEGEAGQQYTCRFTLGNDPEPAEVACDESATLWTTTLGSPAPTVNLSGPPLGDESRIVVVVDTQIVYDEMRSLTYETFEPNGPDCPPTCTFTELVVDL